MEVSNNFFSTSVESDKKCNLIDLVIIMNSQSHDHNLSMVGLDGIYVGSFMWPSLENSHFVFNTYYLRLQ